VQGRSGGNLRGETFRRLKKKNSVTTAGGKNLNSDAGANKNKHRLGVALLPDRRGGTLKVKASEKKKSKGSGQRKKGERTGSWGGKKRGYFNGWKSGKKTRGKNYH